MNANQAMYTVATMCRVLAVAASGPEFRGERAGARSDSVHSMAQAFTKPSQAAADTGGTRLRSKIH